MKLKKSDIDGLISAAARSAARAKMKEAVKAHLQDEVERIGWAVASAWVKQNKPALEKNIRGILNKNVDKIVHQLVKDFTSHISVYVDD